ncbi:hypothetical protein NCC49_005846 [Naganishia albida]|nr:hypothetical protein NCC49_005846 [Naganishia albida]
MFEVNDKPNIHYATTSGSGGPQYHPYPMGQQSFGKVTGFTANQMNTVIYSGGSGLEHSRPRPSYRRSASEDPKSKDTSFSMPDMSIGAQGSMRPLPSPSTGTSFSSHHDFASSSTSQAGNQSLTSPPYTPLPSTSFGSFPSRPSTANNAPAFPVEELKQAYPPVMFMHMPPGTPALEAGNYGPYRSSMMSQETGMVGLGIMLPGM